MRCGVGDYTAALARGLATYRHNRVAVLTSSAARQEGHYGDHDAVDGYERFASIDRWSLRDVRTVQRILRAWKPDIVHLQYPTQGYSSTVLPSLLPLMAWRVGAMPVRTWHEAFSGRQSARFFLQSAAPGPHIVVRPNFADLMWRPLRPLLGSRGTMIAGGSSIPQSVLPPQERSALRHRYLNGQARLIVFFGFVYPAKGVDQLFDIADPTRDAIVIAGEANADPDYASRIRALAASGRWKGRATLTGFLPVMATADLLAAADIVVLPFIEGGGSWNSSINAAVLQGTPVVTTSRERHGLNDTKQVYFGRPNDIADLQHGLDQVVRRSTLIAPEDDGVDDWVRIRNRHMAVYNAALATKHVSYVA